MSSSRYDDGIPEITPSQWKSRERKRIRSIENLAESTKPKHGGIRRENLMPIRDIYTGVVYANRREASKATGVTAKQISYSAWAAMKGGNRRFRYADQPAPPPPSFIALAALTKAGERPEDTPS